MKIKKFKTGGLLKKPIAIHKEGNNITSDRLDKERPMSRDNVVEKLLSTSGGTIHDEVSGLDISSEDFKKLKEYEARLS